MLFIGDDWAEDHHDLKIEDADGRRLVRARLPEGLEGMTRLHELVAEHAPAAWAELSAEQGAGQVVVGIETDRGPWVTALRAAGYLVYAINPMSAARYRERHATSGAKSDAADAHVLAEIVRLDRDHHRPIAGDSDLADAVKLLARAHQNAIWDRTRHVLRLRSTLREFFPAALEAFDDLAAADALILLEKAPSPALAAKLTRGQLTAVLRAARRHHVEAKAVTLQAVLRAPALRQPPALDNAYATIVAGQARIIAALNTQISGLAEVMGEHFGRHPAAEIYVSQPGLGTVLASRVMGEFGDDQTRFVDALLRAEPDHPGVGPQVGGAGPVRDEPAAGSGAAHAGLRSTDRITRRPRLLRRATSQKHRPPRSPAPAREQTRRHPARLPEDRRPLRRGHGLATPPPRRCRHRRLTNFGMECLST